MLAPFFLLPFVAKKDFDYSGFLDEPPEYDWGLFFSTLLWSYTGTPQRPKSDHRLVFILFFFLSKAGIAAVRLQAKCRIPGRLIRAASSLPLRSMYSTLCCPSSSATPLHPTLKYELMKDEH